MRGKRAAITVVFLADGLLLGSWAARIPAVQRDAGLTSPQLGVALFGMSLGALVAMPVAGWVSERAGSRVVTVVALAVAAVSLFGASLAGSLAPLFAALLVFGAGFGSVNVAANAQGVALEREYGRSILSSFHAAFSFGGLAGAGVGALVAGAGVEPRAHFAVLALVVTTVALVAAPRLLPPERREGPRAPILVRPPRVLLVLGAAAFFTLLAEGAAADWSAVYLARSLRRRRGGRGPRLHGLLARDGDEPDDGRSPRRRASARSRSSAAARSQPRPDSQSRSASARPRLPSSASRRWARGSA